VTDAAPRPKTKNGKRKLTAEDKELIRQAVEEKLERGGGFERMNKRHAVVQLGSDVVVVDEQPEQPPVFMKLGGFHLWYSNDLVACGPQMIPISVLWLRWKHRRQYTRVVFDPQDKNPEHYNLWRGFAVKPDASKSCDLFLEHVKDNICAGNDKHYQWVLGVLAHMVQKPHEKAGVAIALRSIEGTGKGFFAKWVGKLLCPEHRVVVSQSAHLTGRFNAHQQCALLIFCDEAFWAGDKQGEGALKHLITDEDLLIEPKHVNPFMVKNLSRLIVASNENWTVPASLRARRWCVLDVNPACANDREYFGAIETEMENGGLEALMHTLSTFDLNSINIYDVPKTAALLEQKEESAQPHVRWWLQCLQEGTIKSRGNFGDLVEHDWPRERKDQQLSFDDNSLKLVGVPKAAVWKSYQQYVLDHNIRSRLWPDKQLHKWLRQQLPDLREERPRGIEHRQRLWTLPPLSVCRLAYEGLVGQAVEWEEDWSN
jgi:hypothetical protein